MAGMVSAQSAGIKAGLNYTSFTGDAAGNFDYRPAYTIGVLARTGLNDLIGVQTEVLYTSKGGKIETTQNSTTTESSTRLNYLDLPVLLSVQTNGLFFELGPQVSFLLKGRQVSEVTTTSGSRTTTTKTEVDITDDPYPIDFGYAAGLGYRLANGFGIGFRYNGGLKNVDDEGSYEGKSRHNTSFQLTLSYTTSR